MQKQKRTFDDKKFKPRVSYLVTEKVDYVDYKNVDLLRRFLSDRGKIRSREITGNTIQQQKAVAKAIKVAREMSLLPYQVISSNSKTKRNSRFSKNENRSDRSESKNEE
jgi:small subunit ribosomal protein S18